MYILRQIAVNKERMYKPLIYKALFSSQVLIICMFILMTMNTGCEKGKERRGLTDIDGNVYDTVLIGSQLWMAENIRTTHLNDGTEIPLVESDTSWANLETPGYCWYGNYEAFFNLNHYGALYNFYAVSSGKLCPAGWHVPDTDEWYTLLMYLGNEIAGGKMKMTGTTDWLPPNTGATNESGFNALPGGFRNAYYKDFQQFRTSGHFWHSESHDAMIIMYSSEDVIHESLSQNDGASVRCIRD
jgi:uncharacterized protein (TIGR02145 family)